MTPAPPAPHDTPLASLLRDGGPLLVQAGLGGACGYGTGRLMRLAGPGVAVAVSTGFVMLQTFQYSGDLTVNWRKVHRDYARMLDLDADSTATAGGAGQLIDRAVGICLFNVPAGLSFAAGWISGLGGPSSIPGAIGTAGVAYGVGTRLLVPALVAVAPTVTVPLRQWWGQTLAAVGSALTPDEHFRQMVLGYDRGEVAALQARLAHDLARPGLAPRDARLLEMKQGVLQDRLATMPEPPRPWWRFW